MIVIFNKKIEQELEEDIKKICETTLKYLHQNSAYFEVNINFVSKKTIKELNNKTRNINRITDVLSFPFLNDIFGKKISLSSHKIDVNPETKRILIGEIFVCTTKAKEQSIVYGHSAKREICYLIVHGLLHLFGYDHMQETDKMLMRKAEEKILLANNITRI